jgi:ubiquinone/menaquinone biosynthesis C-methylase UbiE
MKQRDIFLASEGDAWLQRNAAALAARQLPDEDPLLVEIVDIARSLPAGARILEIGCGDGARLRWIREHLSLDCYGIEPSDEAVKSARAHSLSVERGTADRLPHADQLFDVVVFGFCLYLCDRDDLFRIASEADRVLKTPGWLLILDFYSRTSTKRKYHHREGLFSHKMDYSSLFSWNPSYVTVTHKLRHHATGGYTDDPNEWVATSVLRKQPVQPASD